MNLIDKRLRRLAVADLRRDLAAGFSAESTLLSFAVMVADRMLAGEEVSQYAHYGYEVAKRYTRLQYRTRRVSERAA